ncbi:MAG: hypothetical protein LW826_03825 [Candidatus Jidaibacter sp.]|jgi:serine/threonine protein kinase|nr:hypothetical protein [Candidatus Jidaibacter sp.]
MSKLGIDGYKIGKDLLDGIYNDSIELSQTKFPISDTPNQLENFHIDPSLQLGDFSTEFATAYPAFPSTPFEVTTDERLSSEYYALVFKKNIPIRIKEIMELKNYMGTNLATPVVYGLANVGLSSEERFFVAILPIPKGKSLSDLLKAGLKLDEAFITRKLLKPILSVLNHLHQTSIVHGSINPRNIFINSQGEVIVGSCISEPCGLLQLPFFETVERAQSQNYGKGSATEKVDYYSLGCTLYTLLTGKDFSSYETKDIIRSKLQLGTYGLMTQNTSSIPSGRIMDLIRGLVSDNPTNRWSYIDIDAFLQGRNYNLDALYEKTTMIRAITFNSKEFYSMRAIAHEMAQNWDLSKEFIKTDKLKKWFESNQCESKFLDMFSNFHANCTPSKIPSQRIFSLDDERLIKTLILLDPIAPIRIRNTAFHKDGLGLMMLSAFNNGQGDITQLLAGTLFANIFSIYEFLAAQLGEVDHMTHILLLNKCSDYIKKHEIGFGYDRCLYELNPMLPCQADILKMEFCIGLKDVLHYIEEHKIDYDAIIAKKSIPAFIAAKFGMTNEAKANDLDFTPALQKSRAIQLTLIFAAAQRKTKIGKLEHISSIMKTALIDVVDGFLRSTAIKHEISQSLTNASKTSDIYDLYKAISNQNLIKKDMDGYVHAIKRGAEIARDIFFYGNQSLVAHDLRKKSLKIAVKFSYIVSCFIVLMLLLDRF